MNPWLETHWGDVHTSLTLYARDALQPKLPKALRARVEEYLAVQEPEPSGPSRRVSPDVHITQSPRIGFDGGGAVAVEAPPVSVAQPVRVRRSPPPTLRRLKIIDPGDGGRLVTSIEFLSPANKVGRRGREQYQTKRGEMIDADVNVVEIDLLRGGRWIVNVSSRSHPSFDATPYVVCVTRGERPDEAEVYPASYQEPLPTIAIPLRRDDADVALSLQSLVDAAFASGRYGDDFDYSVQPQPGLPAAELAWVGGYLARGAETSPGD